MMNKQKKNERLIRDLAHVLVSAQYHYTTFSSMTERVVAGESRSFPYVMIEPSLAVGYPAKEIAKKESKRIKQLINKSDFPVILDSPLMQQRIEIMSMDKPSEINQLIGEIKMEILSLETKAAKRARKS